MIDRLETPQNAGTVVPAVAAILGTSSPVGGALAAIVGAMEALGISIKGKTPHASYDQVLPYAVQFSTEVTYAFRRAYSPDEIMRLQLKVKDRFLKAMTERWGLGASLNQTISNDIASNAYKPNEISRQLALFVIWIGTNVDSSNVTEFPEVFQAYFSEIFLRAISDASLSVDKLKGEAAVPNIPPSTTDTTTPQGQPSQAGTGSMILVLAIGGALWYAWKGKP